MVAVLEAVGLAAAQSEVEVSMEEAVPLGVIGAPLEKAAGAEVLVAETAAAVEVKRVALRAFRSRQRCNY